MIAIWFFIRLFVIVGISFIIAGLDGSVQIYAYGYEVHIRLWVTLVFIVLFVLLVWYTLRALGWVHAGITYITRTRRLYNHVFALPFVTRNSMHYITKSSALKKLGKKHPLSQVISYGANKQYDIQIDALLLSEYAPHFIQACIQHNDTGHLSAIRAFYITHDTTDVPDIFYLYESTVADTIHDALSHISYVQNKDLKNEVAYYTALAHIRHNTQDACNTILHAWKTTQTDREKWRLCMACLHIQLSDVSHIVPFERTISKRDGMGMLLLAILSIKLTLWGPADAYITKSEPYAPTDKVVFIKAYLQYVQQGNSHAYIQQLYTQYHQQTGLIL